MRPAAASLDLLCRARRINVVGTSGSGKSTFGRQLAELLGLPFHEMDQLFWRPDWQETPDDELLAKVQNVVDQPEWIIDGNYTRTIPVKWPRTEAVVWLDLSLPRTLYQVTSRSIRRSFSQQELWPGTGNRESLRKSFLSRDSVILWSARTHRKNRIKYRRLMKSPEYAHIHFLRLDSRTSAAMCLSGVQERLARSGTGGPPAG